MSTTAERLFYPVRRIGSVFTEHEAKQVSGAIAVELKAENLVLASREDIRLAVEVAYRETYGDLKTPLNDATRAEIDTLTTTVFSELERSA